MTRPADRGEGNVDSRINEETLKSELDSVFSRLRDVAETEPRIEVSEPNSYRRNSDSEYAAAKFDDLLESAKAKSREERFTAILETEEAKTKVAVDEDEQPELESVAPVSKDFFAALADPGRKWTQSESASMEAFFLGLAGQGSKPAADKAEEGSEKPLEDESAPASNASPSTSAGIGQSIDKKESSSSLDNILGGGNVRLDDLLQGVGVTEEHTIPSLEEVEEGSPELKQSSLKSDTASMEAFFLEIAKSATTTPPPPKPKSELPPPISFKGDSSASVVDRNTNEPAARDDVKPAAAELSPAPRPVIPSAKLPPPSTPSRPVAGAPPVIPAPAASGSSPYVVLSTAAPGGVPGLQGVSKLLDPEANAGEATRAQSAKSTADSVKPPQVSPMPPASSGVDSAVSNAATSSSTASTSTNSQSEQATPPPSRVESPAPTAQSAQGSVPAAEQSAVVSSSAPSSNVQGASRVDSAVSPTSAVSSRVDSAQGSPTATPSQKVDSEVSPTSAASSRANSSEQASPTGTASSPAEASPTSAASSRADSTQPAAPAATQSNRVDSAEASPTLAASSRADSTQQGSPTATPSSRVDSIEASPTSVPLSPAEPPVSTRSAASEMESVKAASSSVGRQESAVTTTSASATVPAAEIGPVKQPTETSAVLETSTEHTTLANDAPAAKASSAQSTDVLHMLDMLLEADPSQPLTSIAFEDSPAPSNPNVLDLLDSLTHSPLADVANADDAPVLEGLQSELFGEPVSPVTGDDSWSIFSDFQQLPETSSIEQDQRIALSISDLIVPEVKNKSVAVDTEVTSPVGTEKPIEPVTAQITHTIVDSVEPAPAPQKVVEAEAKPVSPPGKAAVDAEIASPAGSEKPIEPVTAQITHTIVDSVEPAPASPQKVGDAETKPASPPGKAVEENLSDSVLGEIDRLVRESFAPPVIDAPALQPPSQQEAQPAQSNSSLSDSSGIAPSAVSDSAGPPVERPVASHTPPPLPPPVPAAETVEPGDDQNEKKLSAAALAFAAKFHKELAENDIAVQNGAVKRSASEKRVESASRQVLSEQLKRKLDEATNDPERQMAIMREARAALKAVPSQIGVELDEAIQSLEEFVGSGDWTKTKSQFSDSRAARSGKDPWPEMGSTRTPDGKPKLDLGNLERAIDALEESMYEESELNARITEALLLRKQGALPKPKINWVIPTDTLAGQLPAPVNDTWTPTHVEIQAANQAADLETSQEFMDGPAPPLDPYIEPVEPPAPPPVEIISEAPAPVESVDTIADQTFQQSPTPPPLPPEVTAAASNPSGRQNFTMGSRDDEIEFYNKIIQEDKERWHFDEALLEDDLPMDDLTIGELPVDDPQVSSPTEGIIRAVKSLQEARELSIEDENFVGLQDAAFGQKKPTAQAPEAPTPVIRDNSEDITKSGERLSLRQSQEFLRVKSDDMGNQQEMSQKLRALALPTAEEKLLKRKDKSPREILKRLVSSPKKLACLGGFVVVCIVLSQFSHGSQTHLDNAEKLFASGKNNEALEECNAALQMNRDSAAARTLKGKCLLNLHHLEEAGQAFTQVLEKEPKNFDALQGRAGINANRKEWVAALPDLKMMAETAPQRMKSRDWLWYGHALYANGDPLAETAFAQAVAKDGRSEEARLWHARSLRRSGHYNEAVQECNSLLKVTPMDREAIVEKARAQIASGEFKDAVTTLSPMSESKTPAIHFELGRAYAGQNKEAMAIKEFDRALKHDPSLAPEVSNERTRLTKRLDEERSKALSEGRLGKSNLVHPLMREWENEKPGVASSGSATSTTTTGTTGVQTISPPAGAYLPALSAGASELVTNGYRLLQRGQVGAAIKQLTIAVKSAPNDMVARRYLAHAFSLAKRPDEAAGQFDVVWRSSGWSADEAMMLADSFTRAGKLDRAIASYEDCIAKATDGTEVKSAAMFGLAQTYFRAGLKTQAARTAQQGLESARSAGDRARFQSLLALIQANPG